MRYNDQKIFNPIAICFVALLLSSCANVPNPNVIDIVKSEDGSEEFCRKGSKFTYVTQKTVPENLILAGILGSTFWAGVGYAFFQPVIGGIMMGGALIGSFATIDINDIPEPCPEKPLGGGEPEPQPPELPRQ